METPKIQCNYEENWIKYAWIVTMLQLQAICTRNWWKLKGSVLIKYLDIYAKENIQKKDTYSERSVW